jgi:hypothetical protein
MCWSQCTVLADLEKLLLHNGDSTVSATKPGAHFGNVAERRHRSPRLDGFGIFALHAQTISPSPNPGYEIKLDKESRMGEKERTKRKKHFKYPTGSVSNRIY